MKVTRGKKRETITKAGAKCFYREGGEKRQRQKHSDRTGTRKKNQKIKRSKKSSREEADSNTAPHDQLAST